MLPELSPNFDRSKQQFASPCSHFIFISGALIKLCYASGDFAPPLAAPLRRMRGSDENKGNPSPDRQVGEDPVGCLNRSLTVAARSNFFMRSGAALGGVGKSPESLSNG